MSMRRDTGKLTLADLPSKMSRLKVVGEVLTDNDRASVVQDFSQNDLRDEVDFELFLKVLLLCFIFKYFQI